MVLSPEPEATNEPLELSAKQEMYSFQRSSLVAKSGPPCLPV